MSELAKEKIKDILDNLEIRLANGEIDLQTYKDLKAKWEARLQVAGGSIQLPLEAASLAAAGTVTKGLLCDNCGGPLKAVGSEGRIRCDYCGTTNEIISAEKEFQKLRSSIELMIKGFGVSGVAGAVDKSSRHFIFDSKIFPSLRLEVDQTIEKVPVYMEKPLIAFGLTKRFPALELHTVYGNWSIRERGKPLLNLATKMESDMISDFAVSEDDRKKLIELTTRSKMIAGMSNARLLSLGGDAGAYEHAGRFCDEVVATFNDLVPLLKGDEQTYYEILQKRFIAGAKSCEGLSRILSGGEREQGPVAFDEARRLIEDSLDKIKGLIAYDLSAAVSLESGFGRDLAVINIIQKAIGLYNVRYRQITDFNSFLKKLDALVARTAFSTINATSSDEYLSDTVRRLLGKLDESKLLWFIEETGRALQASTGKLKIKHLLGPREFVTGAGAGLCLYPFYLVKVKFTLKKGFWITKRGEEQAFFSMCDATFNMDNEIYSGHLSSPMTTGFKRALEPGIETSDGVFSISDLVKGLLDLKESNVKKGVTVLPPSVTPAEAVILYESALEMYDKRDVGKFLRDFEGKGFDKNVKSISPEVLGLVYIPYAGGTIAPNNYGISTPNGGQALVEALKDFEN